MKFSHPKPELLAPAGNLQKLKTALYFGADGCYVGLKEFSLRQFAGNFSLSRLDEGVRYAHERGKKVYVAVNILPNDSDLPGMARVFRDLADISPDGVIVGDAGALAVARKAAPTLSLNLSTQLSVANTASARFWFQQGIERIVLARELSIEDIAQIVRGVGGRIEVFIHGAVCIAYSGRCLLSLYWAKRDPRRGACAQGCRWKYAELEDRLRPGIGNPVEEDERGTYFFDASDLCSLPVFDDLVATGVHALKIEGRTRSEQYVAVVTDVYRQALDLLWSQGRKAFRDRVPELMAEFQALTQRGFSTHFLTGAVPEDSYNPGGSKLTNRDAFLGRVTSVSDDGIEAQLVNGLSVGQRIELRSPGLVTRGATVSRILNDEREPVDYSHHSTRVFLPGHFHASQGDLIRKPMNTIDKEQR